MVLASSGQWGAPLGTLIRVVSDLDSPHPGKRKCASLPEAFLISCSVLVIVAGFSCSGEDVADDSDSPSPQGQAPTTGLPPSNLPPEIRTESVTAFVGEELLSAIEAVDPDGEVVRVVLSTPPPGLLQDEESGDIGGFEWSPAVAGEWEAEVTAVDDGGASVTAEVVFRSRHSAHPDALVALGDSIAAGFGLEWRDFLRGDLCFRGPKSAYPKLVLEALKKAGRAQSGDQVVLAACTGTRSSQVWEDVVPRPDGADEVGEDWSGEGWSQLDWAVRVNPGFVVLTVGANDLGVTNLSGLMFPGGEVDDLEMNRRIDQLRGGVGYLLEQLTAKTDAEIVVTNYFNPTAVSPLGLEGCEGQCFTAAADELLQKLNEAIAYAAAAFPSVKVADLSALFEGHEAGTSFGPSWVRDPVEDILGVQVSAYCSIEETEGTWVSTLDCIHPNEEGMRAIATVVAETFLESE